MATQLELHLRLKGARWTMNGLNLSRGYNPRLLSISKDPHTSSENNPNVRLGVGIIIFSISTFFGRLRLYVCPRKIGFYIRETTYRVDEYCKQIFKVHTFLGLRLLYSTKDGSENKTAIQLSVILFRIDGCLISWLLIM